MGGKASNQRTMNNGRWTREKIPFPKLSDFSLFINDIKDTGFLLAQE